MTAGKIAANAITAGTVAANAIGASAIAAGAITSDKIVAEAITGDKIAAETITANKWWRIRSRQQVASSPMRTITNAKIADSTFNQPRSPPRRREDHHRDFAVCGWENLFQSGTAEIKQTTTIGGKTVSLKINPTDGLAFYDGSTKRGARNCQWQADHDQ